MSWSWSWYLCNGVSVKCQPKIVRYILSSSDTCDEMATIKRHQSEHPPPPEQLRYLLTSTNLLSERAGVFGLSFVFT